MASIRRCLASPTGIGCPASWTVITPSTLIWTGRFGEPGACCPGGVTGASPVGRIVGPPAREGSGNQESAQETAQVPAADRPGARPGTLLTLVPAGRRWAAPKAGGRGWLSL